ncbi:MAG: phenylalanine--tRNA ligase subunit beta, partial [Candidatus Nanohaloarchaea archaeon]
VRGVLQVLERDLGLEFEVQKGDKGCFDSRRAAEVLLDGEKIGIIGEFSESVQENWDLPHPAAGFELDVEKLKEKF